ncbi:hypothetical protein C0991_011186 [Blastosporella zonata]|nr:hypothetical protein C0991_011186 [Blastosporella zonata]
MSRFLSAVVLVLAVATGLYQLYAKPYLTIAGLWRKIEPIANDHCTGVPELQACESTHPPHPSSIYSIDLPLELVLYQPTGVLYLACSSPSERLAWAPGAALYDAGNASFDDYVATYDPSSRRVTHLKFANFQTERGFSAHGMDVVQSSSNPDELFVYLVNHRAPLTNQPAREVGADSSVEIFKTIVGSDTLTHIRTVEDPRVIVCPNDVVGYPDGEAFYFTNDYSAKVGLKPLQSRHLEPFRSLSSVGYCHSQTGCKLAITKMQANNGIARAQNDTIYVTSIAGLLSILERQSDNSLVVTDTVPTGVA